MKASIVATKPTPGGGLDVLRADGTKEAWPRATRIRGQKLYTLKHGRTGARHVVSLGYRSDLEPFREDGWELEAVQEPT